jgi:hypothetical protein
MSEHLPLHPPRDFSMSEYEQCLITVARHVPEFGSHLVRAEGSHAKDWPSFQGVGTFIVADPLQFVDVAGMLLYLVPTYGLLNTVSLVSRKPLGIVKRRWPIIPRSTTKKRHRARNIAWLAEEESNEILLYEARILRGT